jgi:hypothetical protein
VLFRERRYRVVTNTARVRVMSRMIPMLPYGTWPTGAQYYSLLLDVWTYRCVPVVDLFMQHAQLPSIAHLSD